MCVLCFALNVLVPTVVDGIRIGLYRHFFHFEQQISGPWTLYHRQGELTHSAITRHLCGRRRHALAEVPRTLGR